MGRGYTDMEAGEPPTRACEMVGARKASGYLLGRLVDGRQWEAGRVHRPRQQVHPTDGDPQLVSRHRGKEITKTRRRTQLDAAGTGLGCVWQRAAIHSRAARQSVEAGRDPLLLGTPMQPQVLHPRGGLALGVPCGCSNKCAGGCRCCDLQYRKAASALTSAPSAASAASSS